MHLGTCRPCADTGRRSLLGTYRDDYDVTSAAIGTELEASAAAVGSRARLQCTVAWVMVLLLQHHS